MKNFATHHIHQPGAPRADAFEMLPGGPIVVDLDVNPAVSRRVDRMELHRRGFFSLSVDGNLIPLNDEFSGHFTIELRNPDFDASRAVESLIRDFRGVLLRPAAELNLQHIEAA